MNGELISVIIPIYNVEKYLSECLDSIIAQTYQNFEVILVENNSTDSSLDICKEYAKKDSRFKVVFCKEQGCGIARNKGLEVFQGDYVTFIDGDDLIPKNYFEVLLIHSNKKDIPYVEYVSYGNEMKKRKKEINIIKHKNILAKYFRGRNLYLVAAWGKLFPKEFVSDLCFVSGYLEDFPATYKALLKGNNLIRCNKTYYIYRKRDESLTTTNDNMKFLSVIDNFKKTKKELQKTVSKKELSHFYCFQTRFLLNFYKYMYADNRSKIIETKKFILKYFRKNFWFLIFKNLGFYVKTAILIFCLSPRLFVHINKAMLIVKKYIFRRKDIIILNYKKR